MVHPAVATVEEITADWPETSVGQQGPKRSAGKMVEKYGPPDEATPNRLVWHENGPWKRTEVRADGPIHRFPIPHVDHLYQAIDYGAPPEAYDDLAAFDGSIQVRRTAGELVAACHREDANVLALNLAHEVATGQRSVEQARENSAAIMAERMAGGSPEYATAFQFDLPEGDQRDPDVTVATDAARRNARKIVGLGVAAALLYFLAKRRGGGGDESRAGQKLRGDERHQPIDHPSR